MNQRLNNLLRPVAKRSRLYEPYSLFEIFNVYRFGRFLSDRRELEGAKVNYYVFNFVSKIKYDFYL